MSTRRAFLSFVIAALMIAGCGDELGPDPDGVKDLTGPPPVALWLRSIEGVEDEDVRAILPRANGGFVTFGVHGGGATFSPNQVDERVAGEVSAPFVAEYGANGSLLVLRDQALGGAPGAAVLNDDGSAFVTGGGAFDAGGLTLPNDTDVFVAGIGSDGVPRWVRGASGEAGTGSGQWISSWPDGRVLIAGVYEGTITFGEGEPNEKRLASDPMLPNGEHFLASYDEDGVLAWARRSIASWYHPDLQVSVTADGGAVLSGTLENETTFDPDQSSEITLSGGNVGFVVKLDGTGAVAWARKIEQPAGTSRIEAAASFSDGSIVVTGSFDRIITLGAGEPNETTLGAVGSDFPGRTQFPDAFLARFSIDGSIVWARAFGGAVWDRGVGVSVQDDGSILFSGEYTNDVVFDPTRRSATALSTEPNQRTPFLAVVNPNGSLRWVRQSPGGAVKSLSDGSLALAGSFQGTVAFFDGDPAQATLASLGRRDAFVARLGWPGSTQP